MTGNAVSRKSIVIPRALRKRFIGTDDLAKVLDKPCRKHRETSAQNSQSCDDCDRWTPRRALRFMRSRGIAIEHTDQKQGKRVVTTFNKLVTLDGVGDVILALLSPDEVRDLVA